MSSESQGSVAISDPGFGHDCVISRRDLRLLLRGVESEREIGYRNLFAGIAVSCGFGLLSTVAPRFGELVSIGADPVESLLLILLTAATLASGAVAIFFHRRLRVAGSRGAYRVLDHHIRTQLEHPVDTDDPRHWP